MRVAVRVALSAAVFNCLLVTVYSQCATSQYYMLKTNKERKEVDTSACQLLWERAATVDTCLQKACNRRGNVINHRGSTCQVLKCDKTQPIPLITGAGADVYAWERKFPCTISKLKMLSCWTCPFMTSSTECLLKGRMEICMEPDAICESYIVRDPFRAIMQYTRRCTSRANCHNKAFRDQGKTFQMSFGFTETQTCAYGDGMTNHHCIDMSQGDHTLDLSFQRSFYQFYRPSDRTKTNCPRLGISCGFTPESCWKLATVMGGNAINYRKMPLGQCDVRVCGTLDIQPTTSDQPDQVFVHANPYPCDYSMHRNLSCLTCTEADDHDCFAKGSMVDCTMQDPVCGYEKLSSGGTVYSVIRRCKPRAPCSAVQFQPAPGQCGATTNPSGTLCTQCMYEVPGISYGCHEPWDEECIGKFLPCYETGTKCSSCQVLGVAGSHWEKSCYNFACKLGGNVAYFRTSNKTCKVERCGCMPLLLEEQEGWDIYVKDPDECRMETDDCGNNAQCINTVPNNCTDIGYECECVPGFEGDGHNCTNINECREEPCADNCNCEDTEGSFVCTVPDGFNGDGYTYCEDCDECDPASSCSNDCHHDANCVNTIGSFTCDCKDGYHGDGRSCDPDPCQCDVVGDPILKGYDGSLMPLISDKLFHLTNLDSAAPYHCTFQNYVQIQAMPGAIPGNFYPHSYFLRLEFPEEMDFGGMIQLYIEDQQVFYQMNGTGDWTPMVLPETYPSLGIDLRMDGHAIKVQVYYHECSLENHVFLRPDKPLRSYIKLRVKRGLTYEGLCGNCDGDMLNDFRYTNGSAIDAQSQNAFSVMNTVWGSDFQDLGLL